MKKIRKELHHTIPVAANIDWHLRNLWDGGWMFTVKLTQDKHRREHEKMRRKEASAKRAIVH